MSSVVSAEYSRTYVLIYEGHDRISQLCWIFISMAYIFQLANKLICSLVVFLYRLSCRYDVVTLGGHTTLSDPLVTVSLPADTFFVLFLLIV